MIPALPPGARREDRRCAAIPGDGYRYASHPARTVTPRRLASDDVTQDRLDIRSYTDTARKHGMNAMDVLHDLMLGRPWRPPAHAFSP